MFGAFENKYVFQEESNQGVIDKMMNLQLP